MKRLWLGLVLAVLLAFPAAAQRAGLYDITGTNLDGGSYAGTMELEPVGSATYRVLWTIGADVIEGVGMVRGLTFVTVFSVGDHTGIGIYDIRPGDVLEGGWTLVGAFAMGTENARPREAAAPR